MTFLRAFKHLLPQSRAWSITADKPLRRLFEGLAGFCPAVKTFADQAWLDILPDSTRELSQWESQFGLLSTGLSEADRRDRLGAAWKAQGGQSPRYIQDTLQAQGFDVYVHEWWTPGTEPAPGTKGCATPRSPLLYLRREFTHVTLLVECGEALAQCGEALAQAGEGVEPLGYPLVNRILSTVPDYLILCNEALAQCGEALAQCGSYTNFATSYLQYIVPQDPDKWPYFLYIGASDITDIASVPANRRTEFETLCLKICPAQQWLGILVEYT